MDDEMRGGTGATYDYGFRIYDSRIAKFLSVDPLTKDYPWYTPYQFAGNTPIRASDLDGLEPDYMIDEFGKVTKPVLELMNAAFNYSVDKASKVKWTTEAYRSDLVAFNIYISGFNAITLNETIYYNKKIAN